MLVSTALLTLLSLSVGSLNQLSSQNSTQLTVLRSVMNQRNQISAALSNSAAWTLTVSKNESFNCMTQAPGCSPSTANGGFSDFILYDAQGTKKLSYDPADPTTRTAWQGGDCPSGQSVPSAICPLKYKAQWRPKCASYPCLNPTIEVQVLLTVDSSLQNVTLNPDNYGFNYIRGANEDTIQSACALLNGTFNSISRTCRPKFASRTCASQGSPFGILTAVDTNGNLTCTPLYSGQCSANQLMTSISNAGQATCTDKNIACPATNCQGSWSACSVACGGGTQTFTITQIKKYGGTACAFSNGQSRSCNTAACVVVTTTTTTTTTTTSTTTTTRPPVTTTTTSTTTTTRPPVTTTTMRPVNCVGSWGACSATCGGGTKTYTITRYEAYGGAACPYWNGDAQACNTAACAPAPVNCNGYWDACNSSGQKSYVITQSPSNGGTACPSSPVSCPVACVGSWGACSGGVKTYSISQAALNGGSSCPYSNGAQDATGCAPKPSPYCHFVSDSVLIGLDVYLKPGGTKTVDIGWYEKGGMDCSGEDGATCEWRWNFPISNMLTFVCK